MNKREETLYQLIRNCINDNQQMDILDNLYDQTYIGNDEMRFTVGASDSLRAEYDMSDVAVKISTIIYFSDLEGESDLSLHYYWPQQIANTFLQRLKNRMGREVAA